MSTFLLLAFVAVIGLILCERLKITLKDSNLKVLGYFWIIKLAVTFILLFAGWIPFLDPKSPGWGYDPQRYYFQSQELIENNWIFFGGLNYIGVLYYYGAIFFTFGHNPVVAALVNSFITLFATLSLISYSYEINTIRRTSDWKLAWALLLPEILWFDVITSRETLVGALLVFVITTIGRILIRSKTISYSKSVLIIIVSLFWIAAVRTSMLLPVVCAFVILLIIKKTKFYIRIYQFIISSVIIIAVGFINVSLSNYFGGETFDVGDSLNTAVSAKENIATTAGSEVQYSANSISSIFLPEGVLQSIIFTPPRMILYILSPLPNVSFSIVEMIKGNWQDWQKLLTILSSIINTIAIPYVLAATIQAVRNRKEKFGALTLIIPYWMVFIAIAGGNLIIHERYRVMATLLLWSCAWLGTRIASKQLIKRTKLYWYSTLFMGAMFYISYKFIFV